MLTRDRRRIGEGRARRAAELVKETGILAVICAGSVVNLVADARKSPTAQGGPGEQVRLRTQLTRSWLRLRTRPTAIKRDAEVIPAVGGSPLRRVRHHRHVQREGDARRARHVRVLRRRGDLGRTTPGARAPQRGASRTVSIRLPPGRRHENRRGTARVCTACRRCEAAGRGIRRSWAVRATAVRPRRRG